MAEVSRKLYFMKIVDEAKTEGFFKKDIYIIDD